MALVAQTNAQEWRTDRYGDEVLLRRFDWRDEIVIRKIEEFIKHAQEDTLGNIDRLKIGKSQSLRRSIFWHTWNTSGGDLQVFEARYNYYGKFVELALGRGNPYNGPVPAFTRRKWQPIPVPTRTKKGKPFVVAEMRKQARRFEAFGLRYLNFVGTGYLIYAAGSRIDAAARINRALILERGTNPTYAK